MSGGGHQQRPKIPIALFGDPQLGVARTRLVDTWHQSQVSAHMPRVAEALGIADRDRVRQSDLGPHAGHLAQQLRFRELLLADLLDLLVVVLDLAAQRLEHVQDRQQ